LSRARGSGLAGGLALVLALAAPAARAAGPDLDKAGIKPPPQAAAKPIPPEHTAAMLADYPPAARAAGIEGKASLECARVAHGAPDGCKVVAEKPAGRGFGEAALALARRAPRSPALAVVEEKDPVWRIDFAFSLKPAPAVTPDVFGGVHVPPKFEHSPTDEQILAAYPIGAMDSRTDGFVVLFCSVAADGHMSGCIARANPSRYGFEAAGLKLAPFFGVQTTTDDGSPTAGTTITIPILFALP
jgi:TonB family protein